MGTTMSLTGVVTASIQITHTKTDDMGSAKESKTFSQSSSYTYGPASDQVQQCYRNQTTVTAAVPVDLDLNGTLTDIFGNTIEFERVRSILVRNLSTVDGDNINVGPLSQANGFACLFDDDNDGKTRVGPGGAVLWDNPNFFGYEVSATQQILRIAHDAVSTSVTFQVVIVGAHGTLESSSSSSASSLSSSSSSQCTSSLSSLSSEKCSESTSSSSASSASSISSQG